MGDVVQLHGGDPTELRALPTTFAPGFVNLEFLRQVGQSMLRGWVTRNPLEAGEPLPAILLDRVYRMVRRHVSEVKDVQVEEEPGCWVVDFRAGSSRQSFSYSFALWKG